jgi:hypothetical protein
MVRNKVVYLTLGVLPEGVSPGVAGGVFTPLLRIAFLSSLYRY